MSKDTDMGKELYDKPESRAPRALLAGWLAAPLLCAVLQGSVWVAAMGCLVTSAAISAMALYSFLYGRW